MRTAMHLRAACRVERRRVAVALRRAAQRLLLDQRQCDVVAQVRRLDPFGRDHVAPREGHGGKTRDVGGVRQRGAVDSGELRLQACGELAVLRSEAGADAVPALAFDGDVRCGRKALGLQFHKFVATKPERADVELAHACVDRGEHGRVRCLSRRGQGERRERGDGQQRPVDAQRDALRDRDGKTHPGERARPAADSDRVELALGDPRIGQQRVGPRQCEFRMTPRRDVVCWQGTFQELLARPKCSDYLMVTLTDDAPVLDAKGRLQQQHPEILHLEYARLQKLKEQQGVQDHRRLGPEELFACFFREVAGREWKQEEEALFAALVEEEYRRQREVGL